VSRLHGPPPLRLPVIVIIPVITVCGGCRGGKAGDEMNTGEDGGVENWVGRGSGRADAGGWMLGRI